ncbi:hypothetical protein NDU88_004251 [Pleurodeles waltl]|uniref:Uncharacterized protein n=1 Tax=Pleurodeles waltl TaxID=8319 RepID=A0AAV7UER3_PLEWA|nr:hypothetical protein NDU88_004251 [Pleurodeles waltl]
MRLSDLPQRVSYISWLGKAMVIKGMGRYVCARVEIPLFAEWLNIFMALDKRGLKRRRASSITVFGGLKLEDLLDHLSQALKKGEMPTWDLIVIHAGGNDIVLLGRWHTPPYSAILLSWLRDDNTFLRFLAREHTHKKEKRLQKHTRSQNKTR